MSRNFVPNVSDPQATLGTTEKPWYKVIASYLFGNGAGITGLSKSQVGLDAVENVLQIPKSYLDTDVALTADSDEKVPSQKAVKAYVDANAGGGGGGAARGLYSGLLSEDVPTQANTGFSAWAYQGNATATDTESGIVVACESNGAADSLNMLVKSVPSTPYSVTALIAATFTIGNYPAVSFGWQSSTSGKYQIFVLSGNNYWYLQSWTNRTTWSSNVVAINRWAPLIWIQLGRPKKAEIAEIRCPVFGPAKILLSQDVAATKPEIGRSKNQATGQSRFGRPRIQLADNGTTISFSYSFDGIKFMLFYSVVKSSGFLGSTGYEQICFGVNAYAYPAYGALMSYAQA